MIKLLKPYRPWHIIGDNGGQVPFDRQWRGLHNLELKGNSVLDIGCAEGLVSMRCAEEGASLVHGVELRERAVEVARSLAGYTNNAEHVKFFQADLSRPEQALNLPGMKQQYDVVIANAVIQKVKKRASRLLEAVLSKASDQLLIRLPKRAVQTKDNSTVDPVERAKAAGFEMQWEACGYPEGDPPYPIEGEAWLALFKKVK